MPAHRGLIGYARKRRRRLATGKPLFAAAPRFVRLAGIDWRNAGRELRSMRARRLRRRQLPAVSGFANNSVKAKASAVPAALTPWLSRCARVKRRAPSAAALRRQTAFGAWRRSVPLAPPLRERCGGDKRRRNASALTKSSTTGGKLKP